MGFSVNLGSPVALGDVCEGCSGSDFRLFLEFLFQDITWQDEHSAPFSWETRVSWVKFRFVCLFRRIALLYAFLSVLMDAGGHDPTARLRVTRPLRGKGGDGVRPRARLSPTAGSPPPPAPPTVLCALPGLLRRRSCEGHGGVFWGARVTAAFIGVESEGPQGQAEVGTGEWQRRACSATAARSVAGRCRSVGTRGRGERTRPPPGGAGGRACAWVGPAPGVGRHCWPPSLPSSLPSSSPESRNCPA